MFCTCKCQGSYKGYSKIRGEVFESVCKEISMICTQYILLKEIQLLNQVVTRFARVAWEALQLQELEDLEGQRGARGQELGVHDRVDRGVGPLAAVAAAVAAAARSWDLALLGPRRGGGGRNAVLPRLLLLAVGGVQAARADGAVLLLLLLLLGEGKIIHGGN